MEQIQERSTFDAIKAKLGKTVHNKNYRAALQTMKSGKSAADAARMYTGVDARELQKMYDAAMSESVELEEGFKKGDSVTYLNDKGKKVTGTVVKRSTNSPKGYFLDTGEFVSQRRVIESVELEESRYSALSPKGSRYDRKYSARLDAARARARRDREEMENRKREQEHQDRVKAGGGTQLKLKLESFTSFFGEARVTPGDLKAQAEGKKAARKGVKYDDNPYEKGSSRHLQWSKGHNAARAAGMKEEAEDLEEMKVGDLKKSPEFDHQEYNEMSKDGHSNSAIGKHFKKKEHAKTKPKASESKLDKIKSILSNTK